MLLIQLAWRNIWRNKMRSAVILCSISIGIFAGIAVLSLYQGMIDGRVKTVIEEETGHIQIHNPYFPSDQELSQTIPASEVLKDELIKTSGVQAISGRTITLGMLSTTSGSKGVQIDGINPEEEYKTSGLHLKIINGNYFDRKKKHQVLIGKKLADKLKLHPGSKLILTMSDTVNNLVAGSFRVAGVYRQTNAVPEEKTVYVLKNDLNELLNLTNEDHEISILLKNTDSTESILNQLKIKHPDLLIRSWKEISPELTLLIKTIDRYSTIILIIIFIALAFGIINTMLMAILERTKEIGMMIALGTGRVRMFGIVMLETTFLTLAGTPPGIVISRIIINYYHHEGLNLSGMGTELMSSFGFKTTIYPVFPAEKITTTLLIVCSTALVSGLLPAIRALRMKPSDALRK